MVGKQRWHGNSNEMLPFPGEDPGCTCRLSSFSGTPQGLQLSEVGTLSTGSVQFTTERVSPESLLGRTRGKALALRNNVVNEVRFWG